MMMLHHLCTWALQSMRGQFLTGQKCTISDLTHRKVLIFIIGQWFPNCAIILSALDKLTGGATGCSFSWLSSALSHGTWMILCNSHAFGGKGWAGGGHSWGQVARSRRLGWDASDKLDLIRYTELGSEPAPEVVQIQEDLLTLLPG